MNNKTYNQYETLLEFVFKNGKDCNVMGEILLSRHE
jgi:hypothetical protein